MNMINVAYHKNGNTFFKNVDYNNNIMYTDEACMIMMQLLQISMATNGWS